MKEDNVRKQEYWIVEAWTKDYSQPKYKAEFHDFNTAWEKYYSFKNKMNVLLQRKFKEQKVA
jgi:hypothetical protein